MRRVTNGSDQTASVPGIRCRGFREGGGAATTRRRLGASDVGNAVANPFPCRTGKLREKIFWRGKAKQKPRRIIRLGWVRGDNRSPGRETAEKTCFAILGN